MESSTETLLVILITILSFLIIVSLAVMIALIMAVRKLVKKIQMTTDAASETVFLLRQRLVKPAGLFGAVRYMAKKFKRK
jgi:predicted Holliday junction resolvase-like endonuclease